MICNITFGHVMPFLPVSNDTSDIIKVTIVFLRSGYQNKVQHDFLVMWHHWQYQYHMMLLALPMAALQSLGQDNQNKVQQDFLVTWCHWCQHQHTWCQWLCQWQHCIPYLNTTEKRCSMIFWSCVAIGTGFGIMWCWWQCQGHYCFP